LALGVRPGDEVIVPANAYVSAATAALQINAIPIFADIDPHTFVLDPMQLEAKVSPRTRLVVPVHLYGHPVNMPVLVETARRHGLKIVEDCAQAHGAEIGGRLVGTFGDAACYSFCCRKHVVAGEGGMVITNEADVAETARSLANKGKGLEWWDYRRMGYSYLMTEIQAAIGLCSLRHLTDEIERRRALAQIYRTQLTGTALLVAAETPGYKHIYFKIPFLLPPEMRLYTAWFEKAVQAENVVVERSYPVLYQIPWVRRKEGMGDGYPYRFFEHARTLMYENSGCSVAEDVCSRLLAACTGPGIDELEVRDTCDAILKVYGFLRDHRPVVAPGKNEDDGGASS
jgi:perosamine synthetase